METGRPSVAELKREFGLTYQVDYLDRAAEQVRGRRVLEIGGALPPGLVLDHYAAASWTSVDYRSAYSAALGGRGAVPAKAIVLDETARPAADGAYAAFDGDAALLPRGFDSEFDVVLSIATLEHLGDLALAVERMSAALRPGGTLVAQVGPIWSGLRGHHIFPGHLGYLGADFAEKTADLLDRLVPWQHLIMTPRQMRASIAARYGDAYSAAATAWIYESSRINRVFYDDYLRIFERASLLGIDAIRPNGARVPAGWESLLPLVATRHPGHVGFDIDSFWAVLTTPAATH